MHTRLQCQGPPARLAHALQFDAGWRAPFTTYVEWRIRLYWYIRRCMYIKLIPFPLLA